MVDDDLRPDENEVKFDVEWQNSQVMVEPPTKLVAYGIWFADLDLGVTPANTWPL